MEIKGQGFILRGWKTDDAFSLQKHADNINVYSYLLDRFPYPYKLSDAAAWINMMKEQSPMLNFAIAIDGNVVGGIGIEMRTDVYRKSASIGYWLGESFRGRGIMHQAVKIITEYTFSNFDVVRIQACTFGNNPRSMQVL